MLTAPHLEASKPVAGSKQKLQYNTLCGYLLAQFFLDTKLNLLLCAFPFAIISKATGVRA